MELRTIALVAVLALLGWGIVLKSDKQSVHMLEGKLHRLGKPISQARLAYKKHANPSAVVGIVAGICMVFLALVTPPREIAVILGAVGVLVGGLGIVGRVRTFLRADQELN